MPAYTASLDAALTLVPDAAGWIVKGPGWGGVLGKARSFIEAESGEVIGHGSSATPALALCAASLRARAAGENVDER